jgi:mannose-6-phosphate isomerase-like protein (cupin superfamily)
MPLEPGGSTRDPDVKPLVVTPGEGREQQGLGSGVSAATMLQPANGCPNLHQRRLRVDGGAELAGSAGGLGESWYVMSGTGSMSSRDSTTALRSGRAIWIAAGEPYWFSADTGSTLEMVATTVEVGDADDDDGPPIRVTSIEDCQPEVTGDREFRVLMTAGPLGHLSITEFVGEIPPGRAPTHHHTYDEVVHVLEGDGVVHLAGGDTPIGPGTSIYLPPYQDHCLENTGPVLLKVLGVFYPAGSPASKRTSQPASGS